MTSSLRRFRCVERVRLFSLRLWRRRLGYGGRSGKCQRASCNVPTKCGLLAKTARTVGFLPSVMRHSLVPE